MPLAGHADIVIAVLNVLAAIGIACYAPQIADGGGPYGFCCGQAILNGTALLVANNAARVRCGRGCVGRNRPLAANTSQNGSGAVSADAAGIRFVRARRCNAAAGAIHDTPALRAANAACVGCCIAVCTGYRRRACGITRLNCTGGITCNTADIYTKIVCFIVGADN